MLTKIKDNQNQNKIREKTSLKTQNQKSYLDNKNLSLYHFTDKA